MRSRGRTSEAETRLRAALREQPASAGAAVSLLTESLGARAVVGETGSGRSAAVGAASETGPEDPDAAPHDSISLFAGLPPSLRGGVFDPRKQGALALAGLALLGALAAGAVTLRARPSASVVPRPVKSVDSASPTAGQGSPGSSTGKTAGPMLVIDVAGDVRRPGLRRLPAGSRVADALAAAGGAKPGTPTSGLNLARKLIDGEQLVVGGTGGPAVQQPSNPAADAEPGRPLDLNAATVADLDKLSGLGPVLAQRIITWRDAHGGFTSVEQLREIEGIGDRKFASLRAQVSV